MEMEEPEWMEKNVFGDLRLWQVVFLCLAGVTTLIVMVCCCFRFRIPRTKQQIEADYQRRKITNKFRQRLESIEDTKMDTISLNDVLELLYEKKKAMDNQQSSQQSSIESQQQSSMESPFQPEGGQRSEPQASASGMSFVKFASKVATLSKLSGNKSPAPSGNKMDF